MTIGSLLFDPCGYSVHQVLQRAAAVYCISTGSAGAYPALAQESGLYPCPAVAATVFTPFWRGSVSQAPAAALVEQGPQGPLCHPSVVPLGILWPGFSSAP